MKRAKPWIVVTSFSLILSAGCTFQRSDDAVTERHPERVDAAANVVVPTPSPEAQATPLIAADQMRELSAAGRGAASAKSFASVVGMMPPSSVERYQAVTEEDREQYAHISANPLQQASEQPVSTFSIDVDTGAYANVRRFLREGRLPPSDAVRVEEMINYFDYAYTAPSDPSVPFAVATEMAPTPWNAKTRLLRIGIQGWKPTVASAATHRPSNLVFLIDVSGSMGESNKLPLVKSALKMLTTQLDARDRISLVVYAGASGVVLEPTPGNQTATIEAALAQLEAGGSTNGASGIEAAYAMARQAYQKGGNNRVILATDGDFNVGITQFDALLDLIKQQRQSGIALTTLGFGTGNYNDQLMEQLADAGQGNYAYIDSLSEAQKVLVDQRDATLRTIAADVKIQMEFNPAVVAEYRLIGYENRLLKREDFNNDKVDAGEIGAGHRVTALYEVALVNGSGQRVDALRYGQRQVARKDAQELGFLRLRYKRPDEGVNAKSRLIEQAITTAQIKSDLAQTSDSFRFAAAVAGFGQVLKGGTYTDSFGYAQVASLARGARGDDARGYAGEFLQLVALAESLTGKQARAEE